MITYSFSDIGSDSLYLHLYKCIKNDILQGNLRAGERLPSKRSLSKNLNISVITVENAYAQLIAEGYIYSVAKKGFFVADLMEIHKKEEAVLTTENIRLSSGDTGYFADFTSNQTRPEHFPFSIWAKLTRELLTNHQTELMTNSPCGGILPLREAIARHLKAFRNMTVAPEQIILGAGTEYLYGLLIQLLGFDKRYALEDPGYRKISQIYESHSVSCFFAAMDAEGVTVSDLERQKIDIVHTSPSHHFPTGIVMPISRRYELLAWAARSDQRYIIEDDYDSEYRLNGQPIPTLQSIDVQEKVIYMNTFTKTLASTVRISYMVLPKQLVNTFYSRLYFYSCTVSNFEQYMLAGFLSGGYFEKHINRMRIFYHKKRDRLLRAIEKSPLSSLVTISEEDSGLHFLMKINTALSDEVLRERLEQAGIKLSSLSQYYRQPACDVAHIFIVNYSFVEEEHMEKAIELIYQALC